jgi:cytochrome c oxidase cbb3-type subunit III
VPKSAFAFGIAVAASCLSSLGSPGLAQQSLPQSEMVKAPQIQIKPDFGETVGGGLPSAFMQVPVTTLFPGAVPTRPVIKNPSAGDSMAAERGMKYFAQFNCIGCHAANGAGGMGPAFSNKIFVYGSAPENIFLTIYQGRPNGMPAWGGVLPDTIIWDLVTYIGNLSNEPDTQWGTTVSLNPQSPAIEQVPAEHVTTTKPWSQTEPFKSGGKP